MGNLFQVLLSSIKAKITPLWTKIKLYTNAGFLKTRVFTRIRKFFSRIFDVKPRNKDDYFGFGRWLISKKLAFAIFIILGILSAYYIFFINPPAIFNSSDDGIKTYKYSSVPLRFTKGRVNILAESGYIAYTGDVEKGEVVGVGVLYNEKGEKIYQGDFDNNMFNGSGVLYYPSGQEHYSGQFKDNLYTGSGIEYRENGTKEYEGGYTLGHREGEGTLFDAAGKAILQGNFADGDFLYQELLGKTTGQVSNLYKGKRTIYMDPDYFVVCLDDLGSAVYGYSTSNTLSGDVPTEGVYVFANTFREKGQELKNLDEMKKALGEPSYEGNAYAIMPEAVCVYLQNIKGTEFYGDTAVTLSTPFDDAIVVESFNSDYCFYIYNYVLDGIRYTFFGKDRNGDFEMFLMEKE